MWDMFWNHVGNPLQKGFVDMKKYVTIRRKVGMLNTPWVYCILELARKQGNKLIRIYRPFTQCPKLWGEARESFCKMGVLKQLYDIIFRNSQPNKQMCDVFPHVWTASSWLKVHFITCRSKLIQVSWCGSGKRLSGAKMLALWLLLGTHTLSSRTESAGVRPLHWVIRTSSLERTAWRLRVYASEDVSRTYTWATKIPMMSFWKERFRFVR